MMMLSSLHRLTRTKTTSRFSSFPSFFSTAATARNDEDAAHSFASITGLSDKSLQAIKQMNFDQMTPVQQQTMPLILKGEDMLAKAKTGTGKTVAFLLPTLDQIQQDERKDPKDISMLVISPTRELAFQIAEQAKDLTKFHDNTRIACMVGGTNMNHDRKVIKERQVDVLVATTGRLVDHLNNIPLMKKRLKNLQVLVLDEADVLLDMGFRRDIQQLLEVLPQQRQTLLFSATTPKGLLEMKSLALKKDHQVVDTVGDDQEQTNSQTKQYAVVNELEDQSFALAHLLHQHINVDAPEDYKVIVFLPTAGQVGYMFRLFERSGIKLLEMHSRKSQPFRKKTSQKFRESKKIVMFTSDVSARGVDYPDVSLVIQIGITEREKYIHRLGRTSRAGKTGQGILMMAPFERDFMLTTLADMPLENIDLCSKAIKNNQISMKIKKALGLVNKNDHLTVAAKASYRSWLGFYKAYMKPLRLTKIGLVETANDYSFTMGLPTPPSINKQAAGKMSLKGIPGLKIV